MGQLGQLGIQGCFCGFFILPKTENRQSLPRLWGVGLVCLRLSLKRGMFSNSGGLASGRRNMLKNIHLRQ